jgi:esterase/lipase superfamily enzyme
VYDDQPSEITKAMPEAESIYVFVHGWNKIPKLAESDYQDLICRFYTHSKASKKKSIIIGLFWPSTEFPPLLNFWAMRERADTLATTGFQELMKILADGAKTNSERHYDLVMIGHSFGERIIALY